MGRRNLSGLSGPKLQFGSDPGAPPSGPWQPPPPAAPPPGTMAPPDGAYYPPPAPVKKGFPWGAVLIGCGVVIVIALAAGAVCGYTFYKKGMDLASSGVETVYVNELTADHTSEQRERFQSLLKAVWTDERKRMGLGKWSVEYKEANEGLQKIAADGKITVEESTDWCDNAYYTLEKNGYWGEGDSEKAPKK